MAKTKAIYLRVYVREDGGLVGYIIIPEPELPAIREQLAKAQLGCEVINFVPVPSADDLPDCMRP